MWYSEENTSWRRFLNRDVQYWIDTVQPQGAPGQEVVYYKHSRPASIRNFDEFGRLQRIEYIDYDGNVFRSDSLVYNEDRIVAGHYFSEPEHLPVLRFENQFKGRRIESRQWWSGADTLYSTERFFFDRKDNKVLHLVFSGSEDILALTAYVPGTDQRYFHNIFREDSLLLQQTVFIDDHPHRVFSFDKNGRITEIRLMGSENRTLIRSRLEYDGLGRLKTERLITARGDEIAILPGSVIHTQSPLIWSHPFKPRSMPAVLLFNYPDPFVIDPERTLSDSGYLQTDYRLLATGQLVQRTLRNGIGILVRDSLYAAGPRLMARTVIDYDSLGLVRRWTRLGSEGRLETRLMYYRDDDSRIIREELFSQEDKFLGAVTRFYDVLGNPYLSEVFGLNGSFDQEHIYFHGAGIKIELHPTPYGTLDNKLVMRPGGDTLQHLKFHKIEYFWIESALDQKDHLIYQRRFTDDGLLDWNITYDTFGRPLREEYRRIDGTLYKGTNYDAENLIWSSLVISPEGEVSGEEIHKLDSLGREILVVSKDVNGVKSWERRYAYRDERLVKSAQLDGQGTVLQISDYNYDDQGLLLEERARVSEDSTVYTISYRYDEDSMRILETFESNLDGMITSRRFYYDEEGRISREEIIENRSLSQVVEYSYFPEYGLKVASYYDTEGELLRQEVQNDYGKNVFEKRWNDG